MLSPNTYVRVFDLKSDDPFAYFVARSADDGSDDHDRFMIASAIDLGETVASGGRVFEYFTEPTVRWVDEDFWCRKIYRFVDRDSVKKRPSRYADVDGYLHVMTADGEPSHPIQCTDALWIIDQHGELHPPKRPTTTEKSNDQGVTHG